MAADSNDPQKDQSQLGFLELAQSVLMAFLGVQSDSNRKRDFSRGKLSHFIMIGLLFGLLFILIIVGVVKLVLSVATG